MDHALVYTGVILLREELCGKGVRATFRKKEKDSGNMQAPESCYWGFVASDVVQLMPCAMRAFRYKGRGKYLDM